MATTPFTTYAFLGSSRTVARNMPDRIADVFNVKDFGALGDFVNNDTSYIQAAFTAAYANGGTIYFPPGGYNVTDTIDISCAAPGGTSIIGAGRGVLISGHVNNGFIFHQPTGFNGPSEIANLALQNNSTWVGSGALMMVNTSVYIHNCAFRGMINIFFPTDAYDVIIESCSGGPNQEVTLGTGYNGTLGIAGYGSHVYGWRSTTTFQTAIQFWGSNSCSMIGNGIEQCECAVLLGVITGWASHCTVSDDILTVGGTLGSTSEINFGAGVQLYGRGLPMKTWGAPPMDFSTGTTIIANLTGSGFAGTYRLNTGGHSITTPVPMWTRYNRGITGVTLSSLQSEACHYILYFNQGGVSHISGVGGNSTVGECLDQNGDQIKGHMAKMGIYVGSVGSTTFSGCSGSSGGTSQGCWYIDPAQQSNVTFVSCSGSKLTDNSVTASIDNGSGGAGTILNISALSAGAGIAIGIKVDPTGAAGVTSGTVITGSKATEQPTKTVTVTIASPAVFTRTSHGLTAGTPIQLVDLSGGVALPTGLSLNTTYFVIAAGLTANAFEVSATLGGSAINTTGSQSGTIYLVKADGSDGLSGYNGIGTYRVNNSQTIASHTMTLPFGPDWVMPTSSDAKTGIKFINCSGTTTSASGLNNLAMTFTSLPGEAGSATNFSRVEGQEFNIVDGAKKTAGGTAAIGDATQGGGTQHIKVWFNGTDWIRFG